MAKPGGFGHPVGRAGQPGGVPQAIEVARAYLKAGQPERAREVCQQVLKAQPDQPDALHCLGDTLNLGKQWSEAARCYRRVLARQPGKVAVHVTLGHVLEQQGLFREAEASHRQALILAPNFVPAHYMLANLLDRQGRHSEAESGFRRLAAMLPGDANSQFNLGQTLLHQGWRQTDPRKLTEGEVFCRKAIALRPDYARAHNVLGAILQDTGQLAAAELAYRQAIAHQPDDQPEAHTNLAGLLLLTGNFADGWTEAEWRWHPRLMPAITFDQPRWDGSDPTGKTLLIWTEQGYGDSIQFVRYAPLIQAMGATVVLAVRQAEHRLFETCPGIDRLIVQGEPLPAHDAQVPLLSLPGLLGTTLETIPAPVPYLHSPETTTLPDGLQRRVLEASGLKIGLVWTSKLARPADHRRYCSLEGLAPLFALPGLSWFSLYKGDRVFELEPYREQIVDLGTHFEDFTDAAWAIEKLDLVITVDTAAAHLAGALGKPVWVLLASAPDWRWLLERQDSPWYPSARLFRQPEPGNWQAAVERVRQSLVGMLQVTV